MYLFWKLFSKMTEQIHGIVPFMHRFCKTRKSVPSIFLFQNCSVAILRKNLHLRWSIKGFKANKPSQHAWQKVYIFHIEKCLYKKRKNLAKSYIVSYLIIFQHIKTIKHILCHLPDAPNIFLPPPPSTQPFVPFTTYCRVRCLLFYFYIFCFI